MSATRPVEATNTADEFVPRLRELAAEPGRVPMREVFALAKRFTPLSPDEIESMLDEADHHLTRVGAVSILDFQARRRSTSTTRCTGWPVRLTGTGGARRSSPRTTSTSSETTTWTTRS